VKVFNSKEKLSEVVNQYKVNKKKVGFVATMGALHSGHLSLVQRGFKDNSIIIVSIFVNPTQFDNKQDLEKYPRTLERDLDLLKTLSNDEIIVYAPSTHEIYGDEINSESFYFDGLEYEMEGKFRQGHFDGVGTIVKRLLEIIKPHFAYFGEKDFQQLQIIKKLVNKNNIPVKIIGCKIHRDSNGLAMSSRNERLKPEYKKAAPDIYKTLQMAKKRFQTQSAAKVTMWVEKQFNDHPLLKLEYFLIADQNTLRPMKRKVKKKKYRAFIAVFANDIRLIDNIALN
jgi:pantoate--beta-alanine ligase